MNRVPYPPDCADCPQAVECIAANDCAVMRQIRHRHERDNVTSIHQQAHEEMRNSGNGIVQAWVCALGLRHQGVLVSAIRGCDNVPREDASKHISRFYRACILKAHCGDASKAGSFMKWIDDREDFEHLCADFFRSIDHYPNHFILHLAHAAEICGYYMPGEQSAWWMEFYIRIVRKFHMMPETKQELDWRLNLDETSFVAEQA